MPYISPTLSDVSNAISPEIFRPAVDLSVLRNYEALQLEGEPDVIVELIDLYLEDAPRRLVLMQESLIGKDWPSLKHEAHTLRGSSGNLGALKMANICNELEEVKLVEPLPGVAALLSCLEQELEQVRQVFMAERQRRLK